MIEKIVKNLLEKGYQDMHIRIDLYNDIGSNKQELEVTREKFKKRYDEIAKANLAHIDYELKLLELRGTEELRCIYISLEDDLSKKIANFKDFKPFLSENFNPEISVDLGKERIIYSFRPNEHSIEKIISKKKLMELVKAFPTYEEAIELYS